MSQRLNPAVPIKGQMYMTLSDRPLFLDPCAKEAGSSTGTFTYERASRVKVGA